MIEELERLYERLQGGVAAMRALCREDVPDRVRLSHARHRLMVASLDRSRFLTRTVYPALLDAGPKGTAEIIAALDRDLARHRAEVSRHVSTWSPDRIAADWIDYRAASGRLMRAVEDRMALEKTALQPILLAFHRAAAAA